MGTIELFGKFKSDFEAKIEQLEVTKAEYQMKLADLDALSLEVEAEKKAEYEKGFAEGLAQVAQPGDKVFSLAELEAEIALAKAPLMAEIEGLKAELSAKQLELDSKVAEIPGMVQSAVAAIKVELAAKYAELQVIESQAETGFADLLK